MIHPISFSFPSEKIVREIPVKTQMLATIIPGNLSTYIYDTEKDYFDDYKRSIFALTMKKGGWDCMRHYEIMANGCIPVFQNIEACPPRIMELLPKHLFIEGNSLYAALGNKDISSLTQSEIDQCNDLITRILAYFRSSLTTTAMASYILEKSNQSAAKSILYLSGDTGPDYLRCITLHGFKVLFGSACHDEPVIPHIYKINGFNYKALYGKGITYTNMLDQGLYDGTHGNVVDRIKRHDYDVIIYGSYHRGMPHYNLITQHYKPEQVILLCGEDEHSCDYRKWVERGHSVFVRELI